MADIEAKNAKSAGLPEEVPSNTFIHRLIFDYMPAIGGASFIAFSGYVMEPKIFRGLFGHWDLVASNVLWFNAQLGAGLYIYNRHHLTKVSSGDRIIYSIFTTVMFNFGSTLLWALARQRLGDNIVHVRLAFGAMSSIACLYMGRDYLKTLDDISS